MLMNGDRSVYDKRHRAVALGRRDRRLGRPNTGPTGGGLLSSRRLVLAPDNLTFTRSRACGWYAFTVPARREACRAWCGVLPQGQSACLAEGAHSKPRVKVDEPDPTARSYALIWRRLLVNLAAFENLKRVL